MKRILSISLLFTLLWCGCKDYLDIVPEDDVDSIETIFEQRNQVLDWVETCYSWIPNLARIPAVIGLTGADELVASNYLRIYNKEVFQPLYIGDGVQSAQSPYGGKWENTGYYAAIRYCNTFFQHIDKTRNMTQEEKDQWTAEVKAVKAFYYFELIRMYGPIILVPKNIDIKSSISEMKQPRSHVDTCFKEIVRLLDEAIPVLYPKSQKALSRQGYFTKEAAMGLKAKALVYQASPLFNGNEFYMNFKGKDGKPLFSTEVDKEKWRIAAEACDEVVRYCESGEWTLVSGASSKSTELLNRMLDIEHSMQMEGFQSSEIIFQSKYMNTSMTRENHIYTYILPRFSDTDRTYGNQNVLGCLSPSLKMVEMFYTDKGLPIDMDKEWGYADRYRMARETDMAVYKNVVPENTEVLKLHLRREPRFYANVAADRTYWQLGPEKATSRATDYNLLVEAYRGERFGSQYPSLVSQAPQNLTGYWLKKYIYSNMSIKTYHTEIVSKGDVPFPLMRLAELYLMQAEAWNEYLETPDDRVYDPIDKVRKRAGIPAVREAWEQYSLNPSLVQTKLGMREIIRRETNIELAFEGHRFWNLRRWRIAHEELNTPLYGWNVIGEDAESFYNHGNPVVVWSKRKFVAPKDYLFPIRSEEVQVSGIVQNPGW